MGGMRAATRCRRGPISLAAASPTFRPKVNPALGLLDSSNFYFDLKPN